MISRITEWRCYGRWPALFLLYVTLTSFHYPMDFLVVHIGKHYESVVQDSTFPVTWKTAVYPSDPPHPSSTWISSPVIITFDDEQHGFTLPATKFGAIGWSDFKAITLSTSPMLETLPFEQAVNLLGELQQMFKKSGWSPEAVEGNDWLKTQTQEDKVRLQTKLFDQMDGVILLIPHKYSLFLHIKCYTRCDERNVDTARYLIDVGLSRDHFSDRFSHTRTPCGCASDQ